MYKFFQHNIQPAVDKMDEMLGGDAEEFLRLAKKFRNHYHNTVRDCTVCRALNEVEGGRYEVHEALQGRESLMTEVPF